MGESKRAGLTLIEVLIGLALGGMLMIAAYALTNATKHTVDARSGKNVAQQELDMVLEQIRKDVEQRATAPVLFVAGTPVACSGLSITQQLKPLGSVPPNRLVTWATTCSGTNPLLPNADLPSFAPVNNCQNPVATRSGREIVQYPRRNSVDYAMWVCFNIGTTATAPPVNTVTATAAVVYRATGKRYDVIWKTIALPLDDHSPGVVPLVDPAIDP